MKGKCNVSDKGANSIILILLFIPVFIAIGGLLTEFNVIDFTYLLLVIIIFGKYYFKVKNKRV